MGMVMLSSWMAGHRENDPPTWFPSRRVVIRGNTFERMARNGLLERGVQSAAPHGARRAFCQPAPARVYSIRS